MGELEAAEKNFKEAGHETELIRLHEFLPAELERTADMKEAGILIVRGGISALGVDADSLYDEQKGLEHDKKKFMRGRVVNSLARHNLCFSEENQEPDYEAGKGRVVALRDVPHTSALRDAIQGLFEFYEEIPLQVEGNYYYDVERTYIGRHGDKERRIVVAARLGADFPLSYYWYKASKHIGKKCVVTLHHGDTYFMTQKACGWDWLRPSIYTLRHAAGAAKYTDCKESCEGCGTA